jgi:hypothetical protein
VEDRSAERVARNDATFREANEHIQDRAEQYGLEGLVPFICECAEESCTTIVPLTLEEYSHVRADSTHFLNVPGHQVAGQGHVRVVEEHDRYVIVEKLGLAGEITRRLDKRGAG